MVPVGVQHVYDHVRQSALYIFWAAVYLYLMFVQQPLTYFFIAVLDWFWVRIPLRIPRDIAVYLLKSALRCISPKVFRRLLSCEPFGPYCGADQELESVAQKKVPFHSVSLQGCAWMLPYHIGVCEVLKREKMVDENTIWLGSSGGALVGAAAAMNLNLNDQLKFCISVAMESNERHALGPFGKMTECMGPHIMRSLPEDAHLAAQGRLLISVTETPQKASFYGNVLIGDFKSRKHLHSLLMASTYIPIYYEIPVRPGRGVLPAFHWDGGFSNNQPVLKDPNSGQVLTTTVSPTALIADISPLTQETCNIEHFLPNDYDGAMEIYERGKTDAERYVISLRSASQKMASPATSEDGHEKKA